MTEGVSRNVSSNESRNTLSVVSFTLAILQFNFIAAVLGQIALRQISARSEKGRGLAVTSIVLGWLQTIIILVAIINPYAFGSFVGTVWGSLQNFVG